MATLATFFRRTDALALSRADVREAHARSGQVAAADPNRLRSLPNEDVYLFCKRIDNSRVVREADPRSGGECWSTIGVAVVVVALLTSALFPSVADTLSGYRLQALRQEQQRLLNERRVLELEQARLLSPARLEALAKARQLVAPAPGQVVHLDPRGDGSLAMNVKK